MVLLLEGSPISTQKLWSSVRVTIGFLVTSLTKALLLRLLFGQAASSRKSLGGSKLLSFKNDGGHHVLGDLQCSRHFLVSFQRSVPRHNPVSTDNSFDFMFWFLLWHALSTAGPYIRQVCAFSKHAQIIEFTTGGLQSSCRNISRMINGNRMHLRSISTLIAKVSVCFLNICKKNLKTFFRFVIMWYCDAIMGYCDVIMGYCDVIMGYFV